jgi:hypothetical protein
MPRKPTKLKSEKPKKGVDRILYYFYDFEFRKGIMVYVNEGSAMHKLAQKIEEEEGNRDTTEGKDNAA